MKKEKNIPENKAPEVSKTPEFIPWIKASTEEKIERCHFVIKDIMEALNKLQKDHGKLEANFFNHKHFDGMLMGQMSQFGGVPMEPKEKDTRTDEEKWF